MSENNKAVAREFLQAIFSGHDVDAIDRLLAPDFVDNNPCEGRPPGREGWKAGTVAFLAAFPDLRCEIDDLIAEGDKVVVRNRLMGPIVEHWGLIDALGFLRQIGQVAES
jgi:predicted ester cyclase